MYVFANVRVCLADEQIFSEHISSQLFSLKVIFYIFIMCYIVNRYIPITNVFNGFNITKGQMLYNIIFDMERGPKLTES